MELKRFTAKVAVLVLLLSAIVYLNIPPSSDADTDERYPDMSIDVDDSQKITSKEVSLVCSVSVDDDDQGFDQIPAKIKGRGNSTWRDPKKPYTLTFDEKIDLFGLGKAKKWVLLANYKDRSLARNALALSVADEIGCEYTSGSQFVNLYLNGKYEGVYQVCEKIETGKQRVDVDEDTTNPDFGFLVELDSHAPKEGEEGIDYFMIDGTPYSLKDLKCDAEGFEHVSSVMTSTWEALNSGDWETIREHIDTDTFARTLIVQELFSNTDANYSSFYFYRDVGGKVCSGPVWDFDLSAGNNDRIDRIYTDQLFVSENNQWYSVLLEHQEFRKEVSALLKEYYQPVKDRISEEYKDMVRHTSDFNKDKDKWQTLGVHLAMTPLPQMVYREWIDHLDGTVDWLYERLDFLYATYAN